PWTRNRFPEGTTTRRVEIESLAGLKFDTTLFEATAGEPLEILFKNVDPLMPHNIVFVERGKAIEIGTESTMMMSAGPAAAAEKHYVPESEDVLFHSSVLVHNRRQSLFVYAPEEPGDYPFLCTFPGHWGVMQGIMRVVAAE
ncbi:MAG: plastocyanin/azurin family copper-binding protein, partial [Verrucomicrobiota bacterium]